MSRFAGTDNLETLRGAEQERAAIVAWLREQRGGFGLKDEAHAFADAIERADHLTATKQGGDHAEG